MTAQKTRLKKGDEVVVITGKDKGRTGQILKVLRDEGRVLVQGINMVKRHQRQTMTQQAGIVEKEASIAISNVALRDPKTGKPTRVGYKVLEDGSKVRVAKVSGEVVNK